MEVQISNSAIKYDYTADDARLLDLKNDVLQQEIETLESECKRLAMDNARLRKQNAKFRDERKKVYLDMIRNSKNPVDDFKAKCALSFLGGMVAAFAIVMVIVICALS